MGKKGRIDEPNLTTSMRFEMKKKQIKPSESSLFVVVFCVLQRFRWWDVKWTSERRENKAECDSQPRSSTKKNNSKKIHWKWVKRAQSIPEWKKYFTSSLLFIDSCLSLHGGFFDLENLLKLKDWGQWWSDGCKRHWSVIFYEDTSMFFAA